MSLHGRPRLNAARRRARKSFLARRDGACCTYCRQSFTDLRDATLDHVVPIRLFRTWSADHLVLACRPCNDAKADRLPLLIALLLIGSVEGVDAPIVHPGVHPSSPLDQSTPPDGESPLIESGGSRVDRVDVHRSTAMFTPDVLRLLARLAHARQSADRTAFESGGRSGVHQGVHRVHEQPRMAVHLRSRADRSTRTRLCSDPHHPARTHGRELA
ncbi:HNH endonuclease [Streptomyces sp. NPDC059355]|uniref:HNH endonuclease n=1 Tax=Streptomyces sp. NPDC059355 TaxID=3346811 RepID=UPI0036C01F26